MKVGLNALGYHINNQSTELDSELEDALKSFQKKNNLDVNGTFNKSTNEKFTQQLVEKANKEDTVLNELLKKLN